MLWNGQNFHATPVVFYILCFARHSYTILQRKSNTMRLKTLIILVLIERF